VGAGLVVLALVGWWLGASPSVSPSDPAGAGLPVPAAVVPPAPGSGAGAGAGSGAVLPSPGAPVPGGPGWSGGTGVPVGSGMSAPSLPEARPTLRAGQPGAPGIDEIQAELQGLTAAGRQPSAAEVDRVLAKLQQNQGRSVVGGVDLQALRNNLQLADRIRVLSEQMQPLVQNPSPENMQKMQAMAAEMQRLQASMRLDVSARQP
jgi:hypothetical protein